MSILLSEARGGSVIEVHYGREKETERKTCRTNRNIWYLESGKEEEEEEEG